MRFRATQVEGVLMLTRFCEEDAPRVPSLNGMCHFSRFDSCTAGDIREVLLQRTAEIRVLLKGFIRIHYITARWRSDWCPPKADYYSIYFWVIIRMFAEASGYLVPNIIRFDQNFILWGLFGGKNVP